MRPLFAILTALTLLSGCAGTFNPTIEGSDVGSSVSSTSANTQGSSNTNDPEESSSDSSDGDSGSGESSDGESSTTDEPVGCGNGAIEADEECDGSDLGSASCSSLLGEGSGELKCFSDCTFDVSACSLEGPQPENGLWSACMDYPDCESGAPDGTIWQCENYLCSFDCETAADCGPSPGGTAVSECRDLGSNLKRCYLSCAEGRSCPAGMTCAGDYCRSVF